VVEGPLPEGKYLLVAGRDGDGVVRIVAVPDNGKYKHVNAAATFYERYPQGNLEYAGSSEIFSDGSTPIIRPDNSGHFQPGNGKEFEEILKQRFPPGQRVRSEYISGTTSGPVPEVSANRSPLILD
jgi:hypothetical protein